MENTGSIRQIGELGGRWHEWLEVQQQNPSLDLVLDIYEGAVLATIYNAGTRERIIVGAQLSSAPLRSINSWIDSIYTLLLHHHSNICIVCFHYSCHIHKHMSQSEISWAPLRYFESDISCFISLWLIDNVSWNLIAVCVWLSFISWLTIVCLPFHSQEDDRRERHTNDNIIVCCCSVPWNVPKPCLWTTPSPSFLFSWCYSNLSTGVMTRLSGIHTKILPAKKSA